MDSSKSIGVCLDLTGVPWSFVELDIGGGQLAVTGTRINSIVAVTTAESTSARPNAEDVLIGDSLSLWPNDSSLWCKTFLWSLASSDYRGLSFFTASWFIEEHAAVKARDLLHSEGSSAHIMKDGSLFAIVASPRYGGSLPIGEVAIGHHPAFFMYAVENDTAMQQRLARIVAVEQLGSRFLGALSTFGRSPSFMTQCYYQVQPYGYEMNDLFLGVAGKDHSAILAAFRESGLSGAICSQVPDEAMKYESHMEMIRSKYDVVVF